MSWNHRASPVVIALAIVAACNDGPTAPPPPPPPGGGSTARLVDLRVEGPGSIAPNATASLRVIGSFDNGTTSDVTSLAAIRTGNASVVALLGGGQIKGISRGEADIVAFYLGGSGQLRIFVLEDGTYRVSGYVRESGVGVAGVRVAVVAGTGTGLSATTDSVGSYALYGLAGEVRIEAVLDGFNKEIRTMVVGGHTTADVDLSPAVAPSDLGGTWRLTLAASSGCNPPVPDEAATRSFSATIAQAGTALKIQLAAPGLVTDRFVLSGLVVDRTVTIFLPVDDFYYPFYGQWDYSLVDRLTSGRLFAAGGTARGVRDGAEVIGTLDGEVSVFLGISTTARNLVVACHRPDHVFRLDR